MNAVIEGRLLEHWRMAEAVLVGRGWTVDEHPADWLAERFGLRERKRPIRLPHGKVEKLAVEVLDSCASLGQCLLQEDGYPVDALLFKAF